MGSNRLHPETGLPPALPPDGDQTRVKDNAAQARVAWAVEQRHVG